MRQRCPVCGQDYGLTHSCPGAIPSIAAKECVRPAGFAAGYYFRLALAIARFDDAAILEASRDSNALHYGSFIWLVSALLSFANGIAGPLSQKPHINWLAVLVAAFVAILFSAIWTLAQYGICHLLARWWFHATGTYLGVLRAMLLGSIVLWLIVIPYVGFLVGGFWSIAVLMRVFEEVDGIERMKAFALAFGIGLVFWIIALTFLTPKR